MRPIRPGWLTSNPAISTRADQDRPGAHHIPAAGRLELRRCTDCYYRPMPVRVDIDTSADAVPPGP